MKSGTCVDHWFSLLIAGLIACVVAFNQVRALIEEKRLNRELNEVIALLQFQVRGYQQACARYQQKIVELANQTNSAFDFATTEEDWP